MIGWPFDPSVYAGLLALTVGFAWLGRGHRLPVSRWIWFGLGLITLWVALETPLDVIGDQYLDSVHMLQHVLLGMVAPPLLLLGLTRETARVLLRVPPVRWLTEPLPAQLAAAAVMVGWHLPPLYGATLASEPVHVLEHVMFIASGLLFYWPVLSATSAHAQWRLGALAKLVYLFVGTLPQDGVGLVLQFSRHPFYEYYVHAPRLVRSLDPLTDQTVAGAILQAFGKVSSVWAGIVIFFRWFSEGVKADLAVETG